MKRQSLAGTWQLRQANSSSWLPGLVPGDVHTALLQVGKIPDPFVGDNEKRVMWVAETDWEYRRLITPDAALLAEEQVYLVCDGLDTLAQVFLNGHMVGSGENMFRQYEWEVKKLLKDGENEIRVLFDSPVNYITQKQANNPMVYGGDIPGGPHLRKAPCQWGWDWGPKLPPIGIWKDIRLAGFSAGRLEDVNVRQRLEGNKGVLSVAVKVERWGNAPLKVALKVTAPDGAVIQGAAEVSELDGRVEVEVAQPQIWWPHGYGAQPLYTAEVTLTEGGKTLDTRTYQVGFRTIELRREPDQWGELFTFFVNGVPVFAKGADWIPANLFPTRISDAYLEGLIRSAAAGEYEYAAHMGRRLIRRRTLLRSVRPYGILIWQDFIFACGIYPADAAFFENVARRSHAECAPPAPPRQPGVVVRQ